MEDDNVATILTAYDVITRPACSAANVASAAVRALYEEVCLFPKPGLVSKVDTGSHDDMNAGIFVKSLFSLRHYFRKCHLAGRKSTDFDTLRVLGIEAEKRMLRATGGVNTHRGAIFNLGILSAAVGQWEVMNYRYNLSAVVVRHWSTAIKMVDSQTDSNSNGARACRQYAVGGARGEACAGFPHVFEIGLPALQVARGLGCTHEAASVQAFFTIMGSLEDTNLLHRGGAEGLAFAKKAAASFLSEGGVFSPDWKVRAVLIHQEFVRRRLSPGGSADLLAATLFIDRILSGAV